jgi:hypothetical protein
MHKYHDLDIEALTGIVCRFSPEHVLEQAVFDFGEHQYRPDAALNDSLGHFLAREIEQTFCPTSPPISRLLSLAGYYTRAAQDLDQVVNGLTEYARNWVLREFLEWLASQKRERFSWELFRSWVEVHEIPEVRAATDVLQRQMQRLLPELNFEGDLFPVNEIWLASALNNVSTELQHCPSTENSVAAANPPTREPEGQVSVPGANAPAAPIPPSDGEGIENEKLSTMKEFNGSQASASQPQGRRHQQPLPVGLRGRAPSPADAPSPERTSSSTCVPANLGPTDVRLELTLKLSGRDSVIAEEHVSTILPDSLSPHNRGALFHGIDQAIESAVSNAKSKTNIAINGPESPPCGAALSAGQAGFSSRQDEYPVITPQGSAADVNQGMAAQIPSREPIGFPDVLPPPPKKETQSTLVSGRVDA